MAGTDHTESTGGPLSGLPWQRREQPSALGVEATARRIGHALWVEERLFQVVGSWIVSAPDIVVKERLAAHCHQHAAHVASWTERLPRATGVDGPSMVESPGTGVETALERMSAPTDTLARLAGLVRVVVPRLIAAHTFHRNVTNSVTDGPTATLLESVIGDLTNEWRDGELMIEALLASPDLRDDLDTHVQRIALHQASIESAIASSGGILGPGTLMVGPH